MLRLFRKILVSLSPFFAFRCLQPGVLVGRLVAWARDRDDGENIEANLAFFAATGQIESNYDEVTDSFDAMDLKPELLRGM